ncbi:MAG: hypothetical protein JNN07_18340 [Verrucomicrobiales bacterium]|nr:hypothetical protein [Verrucomicrobiales bacterium]
MRDANRLKFRQGVSEELNPRSPWANALLRIALVLAGLLLSSCSSVSSHPSRAQIPANLDDAHRILAKTLRSSDLASIKAMRNEIEMAQFHMGLGLWMRNEWGLRKNSALAQFFLQKGNVSADDMSSIVLGTFWCKLHDQPFRLEERIASFQANRRSMEKPKGGSPKDGARIEWVVSYGNPSTRVHLGISTSDGSYWRYEYGSGRGIEPTTQIEAQELAELKETWRSLGSTEEILNK